MKKGGNVWEKDIEKNIWFKKKQWMRIWNTKQQTTSIVGTLKSSRISWIGHDMYGDRQE